MSGFFRNVSSSSASSDSSSEDETPKIQLKAKKNKMSGFMPSDSEEDVKRTVRSAKDKRYEEIKESIRKSRNFIKIKDFSQLESQFESLKNSFKKASSVINKEGGSTPRFYLRFLHELEQFIEANWGDRKNMNTNNSKGINKLRQNLRKYIKESVENDFAAYKESPDAEGYTSTEQAGADDQDEESDLSDDEDMPKVAIPSKRRTVGSEEEEWSESDGSSSSDTDLSDLEAKDMEALRRYFLKAEFRGEGEVEKEKQKAEAKKQRKRDKQKEKEAQRRRLLEDDDEGWIHTGEKERPRLFDKEAKITFDMVMAKFGEICMQRGKKTGLRNTVLDNLVELMEVTKNLGMGPALQLKILLQIVQFTFEHNMKISDCMQYEMWESCIRYTNDILELLSNTPNLVFHTNMSDEEEKLVIIDKDPDPEYRVGGSLVTLIESLDNEYTKILQQADNHSNDYIVKLKGRPALCAVIDRALEFMQSREGLYTLEELCRVHMRAVEQIYYEFEPASAYDAQDQGPAQGEETKGAKLARYCQFVYRNDTTQRMLQRAALCQIYHHALHDYWDDARDLMLMSHIQNNIDKSDVPAQILYNRCICQLGLCAFRQGYIEKAYQALIEIHQAPGQHRPGPKELLGQGLAPNRYDQRTEAQEKMERQQQIPYHMHISIELMECVFLICSMLLDIPSLGTRDYDIRKKNLSRLLFNQLRQSERTTLLGPAETPREHVVAASRAMLEGDWQKACGYVVNEKMNSKVWKLFRRREQVTAMVLTQVKEACLKSYLLRGATVYVSVSLSFLAQMFELEQTVVHSIVSRLIINDELAASIDEPTQCVVMHRQQPTKLQMAALQLADRLNLLADSNEGILDPRSTGQYGRGQGGNFGDRRGGDRGAQRRDGQGEQRGDRQDGGNFDNKRVDFKNVFRGQRPGGREDNRRDFHRGQVRTQNVR